ncbi:MAG TPA: hypothetical protein VMH86_05880 [Rhizomicrobium sp.]|nr:hypothetical protein [Rhizomicrobium sp.]
MSGRIPVGEVIGESFSFGFGRYLPLLGVAWLPLVVIAALWWFVMMPMMHSMLAMVAYMSQHRGTADFSGMPMPNTGGFLGVEILILFCMIWMGMGATKLALGKKTGSPFFYLPGKDELNALVVYIVTYLILVAGAVVTEIVLLIAGAIVGVSVGLSGWRPGPAAAPWLGLAAAVVVLALIVAYVYAIIRLMFLIRPITAMTGKIDIMGSWRTMKGNVLRAFIVALVMALPLIVLEIVACSAMFGSVLAQVLPNLKSQSPEAIGQMFLAVWMRDMPFIAAGTLLLTPIALGFIAGPAAFAYRALVPPKTDAAPPA